MPRAARRLASLLLATLPFAGPGLAQSPPAPAACDLTPRFTELGLVPRAQGGRGTCSVFAVTQALEFALARPGRPAARLSPEFLNWAANDACGDRGDGGFFSDLWKGFVAHGVCTEDELPYAAAFAPGLQPPAAAVAAAEPRRGAGLSLRWIKPWDVATGLTDAQFEAIRTTLLQGVPVCAGMRWPKLPHWTGERLDMAPPEGVFDGHSVLFLGYRDDPAAPGGGAFRMRNSGGGKPASDGWIPYEYARAYVNDAAWIDGGLQPALDLSLVMPPGAPVVGRNHRVSSNELPDWHDANLDMTWLMPGQSVEMPLLQGPGVITHMWFTSHAGWANELDALVLRVFCDGEATPDVEVPLADFFAVGQGKPAPFESVPVQVSETGSLTCYWRMPFARSARIVVTNDNPDRSTGLYWQVDWTQLERLPPGTPRFHARYRRENPARAGDYLFADLAGRGCYVGTVMSVTLAQDGWFGEGDDFFYVDGEAIPSLQGTGSEDYFNDAWGFRRRSGTWCGQPRWQGDGTGDSGVCYRWHLLDPVWFERSLRVAIEHKGNEPVDTAGFYLERPDFVSSVAFWYQLGEAKPWEPLPPFRERRVPWHRQHLVPLLPAAKATGATAAKVTTQGFFGARPVLRWEHGGPGAALTLPFPLPSAGRFAVRLTAGSGPGLGAFDVELDGVRLANVDLQARDEGEADLALGVHELAAGQHTLRFVATGNPGALVAEELRLLPLPAPARRTVFTRHEAHFVRLAIGRAIYAHRLAYGALPENLQVLVDGGLLEPRFRNDENGLPLLVRRVGDALEVESQGADHWKRSWQGLDARR